MSGVDSEYLSEDQLYNKLLSVRNEQLAAPEGCQDSLSSYLEKVRAVHDLTKRTLSRITLSERTLALIRTITRSDYVAASFMLKLGGIIERVSRAKDLDIVSAMANLSLDDSPASRPPPLFQRECQPEDLKSNSEKKYDAGCKEGDVPAGKNDCDMHDVRQWALDHLYNPYPSKKSKQLLSKRSGLTENQVSSWFTQLRRKIGWSKIVKKHYKGDKAQAIHAAQSIYSGEVKEQHISPLVSEAFSSMKMRAENFLKPQNCASIEEHINDLMNKLLQSEHTTDFQGSCPEPSASMRNNVVSAHNSLPTASRGRKRPYDGEHRPLHIAKRSKKQEQLVLPLDVVPNLTDSFFLYRCAYLSDSSGKSPADGGHSDVNARKRRRNDDDDDDAVPAAKKPSSSAHDTAGAISTYVIS